MHNIIYHYEADIFIKIGAWFLFNLSPKCAEHNQTI